MAPPTPLAAALRQRLNQMSSNPSQPPSPTKKRGFFPWMRSREPEPEPVAYSQVKTEPPAEVEKDLDHVMNSIISQGGLDYE